MSRCSRLDQGQPTSHLQMTVNNVEIEEQELCGRVELMIVRQLSLQNQHMYY